MAELGYKENRMHVDDRMSARDMQGKTKSRATAFIAGGVILVFLIMVVALFVFPVPETAAPVLFVLIGAIATALTQVMNFYFGSSRGSKNKDGQVEQLTAFIQEMHRTRPPSVIDVQQLPPAIENPLNG